MYCYGLLCMLFNGVQGRRAVLAYAYVIGVAAGMLLRGVSRETCGGRKGTVVVVVVVVVVVDGGGVVVDGDGDVAELVVGAVGG